MSSQDDIQYGQEATHMFQTMKNTRSKWIAGSLALLGVFLLAHNAEAQTFVQNYQARDVNSVSATGNDTIFGVAAFKVCQIKTFLFILAYVLAAIGLVVFAIRALFGGFDFGKFLPIIGGVFIIAFADLFIAFISSGQAFYCPSVFEFLSQDMILTQTGNAQWN